MGGDVAPHAPPGAIEPVPLFAKVATAPCPGLASMSDAPQAAHRPRELDLILYLHYAQETAHLRATQEWRSLRTACVPMPWEQLNCFYRAFLTMEQPQDPGYYLHVSYKARIWVAEQVAISVTSSPERAPGTPGTSAPCQEVTPVDSR